MSHSQRQQRDTDLLQTIHDILALLWFRNRLPESLPSFAQDTFGGIPQLGFANRFLGPSNPALHRPLHPPSPPPPRVEEHFRETLREMGDSTVEDDTASQPQTAGVRRRNGQAGDAADDSAETTATSNTGLPRKPVKMKMCFPEQNMKLRLDATIWGEINASLKPVVDSFDKDSSCLLLCSGKSDFCRIAPVSLGNDKGSVDHWRSIQRKAWSLRGRWRWPHWAGKPRLELVEIRILALHPTHSGDLCGLCKVVDLETRIRELRDQVRHFGAIASKQDYEDDSDDYMNEMRCCYDEDRWQCWHGESCNGFWGNENADYYYEYFGDSYARYCGMEELMGRLEEISKLEAAALWSAILENPILAAGNSLLPSGLVKSPKTFYEDLRRARRTGHVRGLAHMKFTGFRVVWPEEEPEFTFATRCCGVVLLSCLVVLGARMAYGDWGIAYTAGAFFVALIGVALIWPGHPGALVATKSKTE